MQVLKGAERILKLWKLLTPANLIAIPGSMSVRSFPTFRICHSENGEFKAQKEKKKVVEES